MLSTNVAVSLFATFSGVNQIVSCFCHSNVANTALDG